MALHYAEQYDKERKDVNILSATFMNDLFFW